jgi:hypothetical protein
MGPDKVLKRNVRISERPKGNPMKLVLFANIFTAVNSRANDGTGDSPRWRRVLMRRCSWSHSRTKRVSQLPAILRPDEVSGTTAVSRSPGRPRGTGYGKQDAPLHDQMRQMLECGQVNSRTAAAKQLAGQAYGSGCQDSKVRRLVKSFPY